MLPECFALKEDNGSKLHKTLHASTLHTAQRRQHKVSLGPGSLPCAFKWHRSWRQAGTWNGHCPGPAMSCTCSRDDADADQANTAGQLTSSRPGLAAPSRNMYAAASTQRIASSTWQNGSQKGTPRLVGYLALLRLTGAGQCRYVPVPRRPTQDQQGAADLSLLGFGGPVQAHIGIAVQIQEVLQDVQHLSHLCEDERLVATCLECPQQRSQLLQATWAPHSDCLTGRWGKPGSASACALLHHKESSPHSWCCQSS